MTTRPLGAIWPTSSRPGRCSCPSGFRSSSKYSISAHVISEKDSTGASVKTYGVQHNDRRIERFSIVDKSGDESLTAEQPRQFAAVLTEMAALAETLRGARDDDAVEHALLEICQALLPDRRLAADDNLFEIGTSSLTLAQIYERVDATWPGLLEVTDFFDYPTVRAMAGYLEQRTAGKGQVAQAHA